MIKLRVKDNGNLGQLHKTEIRRRKSVWTFKTAGKRKKTNKLKVEETGGEKGRL